MNSKINTPEPAATRLLRTEVSSRGGAQSEKLQISSRMVTRVIVDSGDSVGWKLEATCMTDELDVVTTVGVTVCVDIGYRVGWEEEPGS